jgi:hypothetical protein
MAFSAMTAQWLNSFPDQRLVKKILGKGRGAQELLHRFSPVRHQENEWEGGGLEQGLGALNRDLRALADTGEVDPQFAQFAPIPTNFVHMSCTDDRLIAVSVRLPTA